MSLTKALLFPGQGSQSSGMLTQRGLAQPSILETYKHEIDEFSNLIDNLNGRGSLDFWRT